MTPAARTSSTNLYDLTRPELVARVASWGFSPVHGARLWTYLYLEGATDFSAMTELPARLRARLAAEVTFGHLAVARETHSSDGFTRKYVLALADGQRIETVLMRYTGRVTACLSSQAGCAMGCVFCATGQMGFTRHLTAGEIVAQALHVDRVLRETAAIDEGPAASSSSPGECAETTRRGPDEVVGPSRADATICPPLADPEHDSPHHRHERLRNIVLMGMGEPLHNYDAVLKAVDILRDPTGLALGAKKITLSTVGVVPGIVRLADERRAIHLAVSLHGATQAERAALVPAARAWPLHALMEACRYYIEKLDRRIFFEWTLIEGKNDGPDQAHAVGSLLRGLQAQVNLIPLNPTAGYTGAPSRTEAAKRFQDILTKYGLPSTVRQRRGIDIAAGCGQLAIAT